MSIISPAQEQLVERAATIVSASQHLLSPWDSEGAGKGSRESRVVWAPNLALLLVCPAGLTSLLPYPMSPESAAVPPCPEWCSPLVTVSAPVHNQGPCHL